MIMESLHSGHSVKLKIPDAGTLHASSLEGLGIRLMSFRKGRKRLERVPQHWRSCDIFNESYVT